MSQQSNNGTNQLILPTYTEDAYLAYAVATVKGRALADVEDGQKPVQRRILYTMHQLGLTSAVKPVKAARIVGDVLGKYHPHGDSAAYDAMVRMAQPFSLRYPLIIGQGNYGSRDGDPAAAMRYTEARLSVYAELLLAELGQGTVDFVDNYDGALKEPSLLPSRLPMLLMNGSMGIAVGMACDIPPHNLREVADAALLLLKNPQATLDDILQVLHGPDFPDGGQLVSSTSDVRSAYSSGRGVLRCRARWVKEDLARGQWQLVVTELPYQVSTKTVLEQLDALTNPAPPAGKKTLTQQQTNLKQLALEYLEKATDESDKDNAVRLVLVPRTSKVDPEQMMGFLLANTSLEDSVSVNMTTVGLDGRPQTKGLLNVLQEWIDFRQTTVTRRTQWELEVCNRRIHTLEGRLTVYLNLDAVIDVIREGEDPRAELQSTFGLSESQADDVLEMRLRQLNRLEGLKLERELAELRTEAMRLQKLLESRAAMNALIASEIARDKEKYGDDRRTLVKEASRKASGALVRSVVDENVTVVLSKNLWLKAYKGKDVEASSYVFKAGDSLLLSARARTARTLVLLDTSGRAYSIDVAQVPTGRGEGAPLSTFIELQAGAKPHAMLCEADDALVLLSGSGGHGFAAPFKAMVARPRAGKAVLSLSENELPLSPILVPADLAGSLIVGASDGKLLAFPLNEVSTMDKGKGTKLMTLSEGARACGIGWSESPVDETLLVDEKGRAVYLKLAPAEWEKHMLHRARKGALLPRKALFRSVVASLAETAA